MYEAAIGLRIVFRKFLAVSAFTFCIVSSGWAAKDSVPDWVRAAAAQTVPAYPPRTNAVVLLDDTTYTVAPDGRATEHYRRVVKILRPEGRDEGIVHVNFDKDTKILSLHTWAIGHDGHEYALKDNEYRDIGVGEGDLLFDEKYRIAKAPGSDPGGIVAYEYEQQMRPYRAEKVWFFQEDIPSLKQVFTLELPAGFSQSTVWSHHAPVNGIDLEHGRLRWELENIPGIDLEDVPMRPSEVSLAGHMTVSYSGPGVQYSTHGGTWQGIGEWYEQLAKDRLISTPDIDAKAKELSAGKTDFYEKTEAIGEFVQKQIRYFVIEMGIGGNQPHFASDIFQHRYGDCKDKATLLSAMLSSLGVHSTLMMVDDRRGAIDPDAPSTWGDHMIAAIEVPKGYSSPKLRSVITAKTGRQYLIFDPTWEKTPFGQLEHELQGSYGLLVEGSDSQIVALPVLAPELNAIHRTATLQLQADGSLKGTVTEKRFGDVSHDRRMLYTMGTAKEQSEYFDHELKQDFTMFNVSDVKVENVNDLNKDLITSYSLNADRYARSMGSLLMVRPRVIGDEAPWIDRKPRLVPIDLRETMLDKDDYDITLPAGYAVDEIPDPVKIDVGFASYESSTKVDGNVMHYTRTYTVRQVTLPPEKYADLQRLAGVIAADEDGHAVLKKQ
jgi:Domain of Unknown Function with PDB structure (DUF3857)/Transglutaminase-like superfamily